MKTSIVAVVLVLLLLFIGFTGGIIGFGIGKVIGLGQSDLSACFLIGFAIAGTIAVLYGFSEDVIECLISL